MLYWSKYLAIRAQGLITGKSVVSFFGTCYLISGNVVKRLGK